MFTQYYISEINPWGDEYGRLARFYPGSQLFMTTVHGANAEKPKWLGTVIYGDLSPFKSGHDYKFSEYEL